MRSRAPQFFAVVAVLIVVQAVSSTQVLYRPTPEPIVTAENTWWYLEGEPLTFAGSIYYPTGPNVYFNPYEMVRTGDYQGIPLYSRTTIEPYSIVYVPLPGRVMKPYERLRAGDLAGTVGSTTPSFPLVHSPDTRELPAIGQAPAPPTHIAPTIGTHDHYASYPLPHVEPPAETAPAAVPPRGPLVSARTPEGLDGLFIEYRDRRWFLSGRAVEFEKNEFTRVGEYAGFPVYRRGEDLNTLYVSVSEAAGELLTPYSLRR